MAKAKKKQGTCKTCRFGEEVGDKIECHRLPPISDGNGVNSEDKWPLVPLTGWCGEHSEWK